MQVSDHLIQACIAQDRQAQKQLYELLLPYLRAIAHRYLRDTSYAKDVLQESFVRILKHIHQYDPNKAPFASWAAKVVINNALNYNTRVIHKNHEDISNIQLSSGVDSTAIQKLSNEDLLLILKQMPSGYFEVFNLFVIDGYKHNEIAEILGITVSLSRKRLSRAKQWLRDTFDNNNFQTGLNPLSFILN